MILDLIVLAAVALIVAPRSAPAAPIPTIAPGRAAVLAKSPAAPARRWKVCAVSLNEPHELDVFRANLDPTRFELIDVLALAKSAGPPAENAAGSSWLENACRPETRCDVVVYSAEFAGRFFGKNGPSLGLQEMEEASCKPQCAGLFRQPLEVFLLACNTLASKSEDSRTPEQYLEVLLDHGFDRASAERVVELRYGPLGPSFRESLRRIFAGVPRIYGFSSVAPRGEYTAPMLARYFRSKTDYASSLVHSARATDRNTALMTSFKGTSLTQTTGLTAQEAGAVDRQHICALYDESRSVGDRLQIAYGFMLRADALSFVPSVEVFLSRHPADSYSRVERSIYTEIQTLDAPRDAVLNLVDSLNVSALKLELAHFAVLVGWLHPSELHQLAVNGARELFHQPLTAEVVDIMCEITKYASLRDDFTADDIPFQFYGDPSGLQLLSCLKPTDRRISPRIVPALRSDDWMTRQWGAYALTQLMPRDELVLQQLVPYIHDRDIGVRIRWIFQNQGELPKSVQRRIREVAPSLLQNADANRSGHNERPDDDPHAAAGSRSGPALTSR